jgi:hypothetical protein
MTCYTLFANVWQFLLSTLSFQYNAILTGLLANEEWQNYSNHRKSLRVSGYQGMQRDTYFLSLPWRYGVPQMVLFTFLHWTFSQCVFVVPVETYMKGGVYAFRFATLGFSVWPMITCK